MFSRVPNFVAIAMVPLLVYTYKGVEDKLSNQLNEIKGSIEDTLNDLGIMDSERDLFHIHYLNNCSVGPSLVCNSVDPNGLIETYQLDNKEEVYFAKLESIRNNEGMREAANLILKDLPEHKRSVVLQYPRVGTHVAWIDMVDVLTKSEQIDAVKFILTDDFNTYKTLKGLLVGNLKEVLSSADFISDLQISKAQDRVTFKLNGKSVEILILVDQTYGDRLPSDVCVVHDPGMHEDSIVMRYHCDSLSILATKGKFNHEGFISNEGDILGHCIDSVSGDPVCYDSVDFGENRFDHNHAMVRFHGNFAEPEPFRKGENLVYMKSAGMTKK